MGAHTGFLFEFLSFLAVVGLFLEGDSSLFPDFLSIMAGAIVGSTIYMSSTTSASFSCSWRSSFSYSSSTCFEVLFSFSTF